MTNAEETRRKDAVTRSKMTELYIKYEVPFLKQINEYIKTLNELKKLEGIDIQKLQNYLELLCYNASNLRMNIYQMNQTLDHRLLIIIPFDMEDLNTKKHIDMEIENFKKNQNEVEFFEEKIVAQKITIHESINVEIDRQIELHASLKEIDISDNKTIMQDSIYKTLIEKLNILNLSSSKKFTTTDFSIIFEDTPKFKFGAKTRYEYDMNNKDIQELIVITVQKVITDYSDRLNFKQKYEQQKNTINTKTNTLFQEYDKFITLKNKHNIVRLDYNNFSAKLLDTIKSDSKYNLLELDSLKMIEIENEELVLLLEEAYKVLTSEHLDNEKFIDNSILTGEKIKEILNDKIINTTTPYDKFGYKLDKDKCFEYIKKNLYGDGLSKKNIQIMNKIGSQTFYAIDFENEKANDKLLSVIGKSIATEISRLEEEYNSSEDPIILIDRLEKELADDVVGLDLDQVTSESFILPYDVFQKLKSLYETTAYKIVIEGKITLNDNSSIVDAVIVKFISMYKRYYTSNIIESSAYRGDSKRANCLVANFEYDEEYKFANIFFGTQVFRKDGKLCLKISFNADVEVKLKSEQVEERLSSTYDFFKMKYMPVPRFNDANTVNVTKVSYLPKCTSEYMIDSETKERTLNTFIPTQIDSSKREGDFPITRKMNQVLFKGKDTVIQKIEQVHACMLQNKTRPNFILVFKSDNTIGESSLQHHEAINAPLFHKEQCVVIDGLDLLKDLKTDWNDKSLVLIDNLPTTTNATDKRMLKKNLMKIELHSSEHTCIIISTTEVDPLDLHKDIKGYMLCDFEADLSKSNYLGFGCKTLMLKALKKENPFYINYLFNLPIPTSIDDVEPLITDFTKYCQTFGNRISIHARAHMSMDVEFFEVLNKHSAKGQKLLLEIKKNFTDKRPHVSQFLMIDAVILMEKATLSREDINASFHAEYPTFFSKDKTNNTRQESSDERFWIKSPYNDYYEGTEYDKNVKLPKI